jgi:hypothetical protein
LALVLYFCRLMRNNCYSPAFPACKPSRKVVKWLILPMSPRHRKKRVANRCRSFNS